MRVEPENGTRHYELTPLQQKILYAEKHNKDYGIYFSVHYDERWSRAELEPAIQRVMNSVEAFSGRIINQGGQYRFAVDRGFKDYRSAASLRGRKISIFEGERLAAYYLREDERCIEFLMHHLVMDGDSLYLFLDGLEQELLMKNSPLLQEGSYFREHMSQGKPLPKADGYAEQIRQFRRADKDSRPYAEPVYGRDRLSAGAFRAAAALSGKLRVTRFGVILLALALLSPQQKNLVGVVVSRRDHRQQAGVIGNFTDIAPVLLQVEESLSYAGNAQSIFRELFHAINGSAALSYEEYMELLGYRGYDYVLSYTRMPELERNSAVFSQLELGEYLHKYNNHLQFNEYEAVLDYEACYEQPFMQHLYGGLEEMLLELDQLDLSQPVGKEHVPPPLHLMETAATAECTDGPRSGSHWFPDVGEDENLFNSSISSMDIARMITDIDEHLGVQLSYQDIYASGTLRELKQLILDKAGTAVPPQRDREVPEEFVCPNFMKVLFIDSFRFKDSKMYDVKYAYRISEQGTAELTALQAAIEHVIACNDVFFTEYTYADGEVRGRVRQDRHVEIEQLTLSDPAQLDGISSSFRLQGGARLWDIRLITLLSTQETYLYLNMHHLLIDQVGLTVLLGQIEDSFNGRPVHYTQYAQIAGNYEAAISAAVQGWQPLLRYNAYPCQGKPLLAKGSYHVHEIAFQVEEAPYSETERRLLAYITNRLAPHFYHTQGYVGAVYHGRVIPGATKVIHSFARVLPVFFNTADEEVLRESLATAHRYQAAAIYDLNGAGFSLEFPAIVFQTLVADSNEGALFDRTLEFPGMSKFQILINLQLTAADCRLSLYIDDQIYHAEEEAQIVRDVHAAVQELAQKAGEAEHA